jgi:hypothetical protein
MCECVLTLPPLLSLHRQPECALYAASLSVTPIKEAGASFWSHYCGTMVQVGQGGPQAEAMVGEASLPVSNARKADGPFQAPSEVDLLASLLHRKQSQ